jgi:hypothetical protein
MTKKPVQKTIREAQLSQGSSIRPADGASQAHRPNCGQTAHKPCSSRFRLTNRSGIFNCYHSQARKRGSGRLACSCGPMGPGLAVACSRQFGAHVPPARVGFPAAVDEFSTNTDVYADHSLGFGPPPCRFKIPVKPSEQRKRTDPMVFRRILLGGPDPVAAVLGLIA